MCLLLIVNPTNSIRVKDNFQYCEVHDNRAIWDLPEICTNNIKRDANTEKWFTVLDEQTNPVSGQGWECSIMKTTFLTYTNLLFQEVFNKYDERIEITKEDCMNMVQTKKCNNQHMECNKGYCQTVDNNVLRYPFMITKHTIVQYTTVKSSL